MRQANTIYPLGDREDFSIIFHELWDYYLSYLGPAAALLYCFLRRHAQQGLPGPISSGWAAEVCAPLGLSVPDSHQAWARLQEMGLVLANSDGSYSLAHPKNKAEFQEAFADLSPKQQQFPALSLQAGIELDATQRAMRRRRAETSLYSFVEQQFGRALNSTETERLTKMEEGHARELVELAVEQAVIGQALSIAYVEQVLFNWRNKGITTIQAAKADAEQWRLEKARRSSRRGKASEATKASAGLYDDLDLYRSPGTPPPKEEA